jgi:hypothetical protein
MIFLLPLAVVAKAVTATVTVGQAVGIGAMALGVGAGIKGAVDFRKAKQLKAEADAEYSEMASRVRSQARMLKKKSQPLAG